MTCPLSSVREPAVGQHPKSHRTTHPWSVIGDITDPSSDLRRTAPVTRRRCRARIPMGQRRRTAVRRPPVLRRRESAAQVRVVGEGRRRPGPLGLGAPRWSRRILLATAGDVTTVPIVADSAWASSCRGARIEHRPCARARGGRGEHPRRHSSSRLRGRRGDRRRRGGRSARSAPAGGRRAVPGGPPRQVQLASDAPIDKDEVRRASIRCRERLCSETPPSNTRIPPDGDQARAWPAVAAQGDGGRRG